MLGLVREPILKDEAGKEKASGGRKARALVETERGQISFTVELVETPRSTGREGEGREVEDTSGRRGPRTFGERRRASSRDVKWASGNARRYRKKRSSSRKSPPAMRRGQMSYGSEKRLFFSWKDPRQGRAKATLGGRWNKGSRCMCRRLREHV